MRLHDAFLVLPLLLGSASGQDWQVLSTIGFGEHTMVHDRDRDRLVMFAYAPQGPQLVEWDGTSWLQTWLPNGPAHAPRVPRLAYDQARRETVLLYDYRTWRYDGAAWQLAATAGPGGTGTIHDSSRSVTAYDEVRQLVVSYDAQFGVTSEWNGTGWRMVQAQMGVLTSPWAFLGYDPVRQQIVGFTPLSGGAFAWDGTAWNQIPEGARPAGFPPRQPALCTDRVRNRLFAFGGFTAASAADNRLWQWDGTAWTQVATGPVLNPVTMAGHVGSGMLVLFGYTPYPQHLETWGYDGSFRQLSAAPCLASTVTDPLRQRILGVECILSSMSPQQTWEWSGATWQRVGPQHPQMTGLVFDSTRGTVLGIESNVFQPNVRTWSWTGSGWQRLFPPVDPPWQPWQALCNDPVRGVVVMFGFGGTWEWNGSAWQERLSPHRPFVANSAAAVSSVYDAAANVVRLVVRAPGGNEEWTWDGTDWTQVAAANLPAVTSFKLAVDGRSGRILLLTDTGTWERTGAGWQAVSSTALISLAADVDPFTGVLRSWAQGTWTGFTANAANVVRYGSGCGAVSQSLAGLGLPTPFGDDLRLELVRTPPTTAAALFASLSATSIPLGGGCTLLIDAPVHLASGVTSATGAASFPVAIPDLATLLGLDVHLQSALLVTGGPFAGVAALTNGVRVRVGD